MSAKKGFKGRVFNTVTMEWWKPMETPASHDRKTGEHPAPEQKSKFRDIPAPRGGHSAVYIAPPNSGGEGGTMWVFGGYGGFGYARRDMDDVCALDTTTWQWRRVTPKGLSILHQKKPSNGEP